MTQRNTATAMLLLAWALWGCAASATSPAKFPAVRPPRGPIEHWVGRSFAGLRITDNAHNALVYGTCDASHGECEPPLGVSSSSICIRNPLSLDVLPRAMHRIRGVPVLDYGYGFDVLTGSTTVTLYAHESLARRAATEVRPRSSGRPARRLSDPRLPRWVLRQLRLVEQVHARLGAGRRARRRLGISHSAILFEAKFARLLGSAALRGLKPMTESPGEVIGDRQTYALQTHGEKLSAAQAARAQRYVRLLRQC
jgi:hypothetical protein